MKSKRRIEMERLEQSTEVLGQTLDHLAGKHVAQKDMAAVREDVKELLLALEWRGRCPICGDSGYVRMHYEGYACRRLKETLKL